MLDIFDLSEVLLVDIHCNKFTKLIFKYVSKVHKFFYHRKVNGRSEVTTLPTTVIRTLEESIKLIGDSPQVTNQDILVQIQDFK